MLAGSSRAAGTGLLEPGFEVRVSPAAVSRAQCLRAYSSKSKSMSDTAVWSTPHIASRKSDM